jgi:hypothetical protein
MSTAWLWIPGAYGSTQNDGWLQVLSFHWEMNKTVRFSVTPDNAEPSIFSKCVRGDIVDEIILFIEPQTAFRFYQSMITNVSSSGGNIRTLSIQILFDKYQASYSGNP